MYTIITLPIKNMRLLWNDNIWIYSSFKKSSCPLMRALLWYQIILTLVLLTAPQQTNKLCLLGVTPLLVFLICSWLCLACLAAFGLALFQLWLQLFSSSACLSTALRCPLLSLLWLCFSSDMFGVDPSFLWLATAASKAAVRGHVVKKFII